MKKTCLLLAVWSLSAGFPRLGAGWAGPPAPDAPRDRPPGGPLARGDGAGFAGPIVIIRGGRYRGHWRSDDPKVAAVTVRTTEPVVIEESTIEGRSHLIATDGPHADITVRDTTGIGLDPRVAGSCPGRFLNAEYFDNVAIENNSLSGTSGIYLLNYRGDRSPGKSVRVLRNRVLNIDGRISDGRGGVLDFNRHRGADAGKAVGFKIVQFLQLDKVRGVPGMEVAWNEVVNEPGRSRVEDNVNIYLSGGTADRPLLIHDNYVLGGYNLRPWERDRPPLDDWSYTGGGLMLGDGRASTAAEAAGFVRAEGNQIVSTTNHGIAISAGHDILFANNRIVSAGALADGRPIPAQNVGAFVWDMYKSGPAAFFNNRGEHNLIGWVKQGARNDWWTPDASSWEGNDHWPGEVTPATEAAEFRLWRKKLADASVAVGPRSAR